MKKSNIISVVLVVMLVLSICFSACTKVGQPSGSNQPGETEKQCTSRCSICGKCTDTTCTLCTEKCEGHESVHVCENKCKVCGLCLDKDCTNSVCQQKCTCEPTVVTHTSWIMLENTDFATTVHLYETNKEGPAIAIVGGIHGDEIAGWNEGLALVNENSDSYIGNMKGICGTILVIPQANILADTVGVLGQSHRYLVINNVYGEKDFTDLNRSFPIGTSKKVAENTAKISKAIVDTVEDFDKKYHADYIIDLHESRHSWTDQVEESASLGDTLIYDNDVFTMEEIFDRYNTHYRLNGEPTFASMPAVQKGTFCMYFTQTYPDKVVFTIETNRNEDKTALEKRVRQQHGVLCAMFDVAWERI